MWCIRSGRGSLAAPGDYLPTLTPPGVSSLDGTSVRSRYPRVARPSKLYENARNFRTSSRETCAIRARHRYASEREREGVSSAYEGAYESAGTGILA